MLPVELKTFARRAKFETTLKYIHTDEQKLREGVDLLPVIAGMSGAAAPNVTGSNSRSKKASKTASALASQKRRSGHRASTTVIRTENPETTQPLDFSRGWHQRTLIVINERDGTRTRNHRIDSPVL
jgi:hypothetical protein